MLLTSAADTKSSPSRAAGQDDQVSGAAADLAPPISGSPAAESSDRADLAADMESDEPTSSDGQPDEAARGAAAGGVEVQLSVPAEENFAFKSYINAHEEDERDHEASADRRVEWREPGRKRSCKRAAVQLQPVDKNRDNNAHDDDDDDDEDDAGQARKAGERSTEQLRLLVRRREAGALIGKRGANIKRLRETFRNSLFSIPDTGNGPERVVCVASEPESIGPILADIAGLLVEKSPENDEQVELKLLIHSSHAGSIIGMGGQSIKKLRNESKAAIKIYEMCCPLSNERVCAIKARPPVVVSTIKLIQTILRDNQIKGTVKPYDALHFDLSLVDKYGGYLPEEPVDMFAAAGGHSAAAAAMAAAAMAAFAHDPPSACRGNQSAHGAWQAATGLPGDGHFHCGPCEMHAQPGGHAHKLYREAPAAAFQRLLANTIQSNSARGQQQQVAHETTRGAKFQHHYHHNNQQPQQQQHRQHPAAGRSGRFHPYGGAAALGSCQPPTPTQSAGYRSSNPRHSSALHFPSAFAAAAAAAAGQQSSPRAPYSAGALNQFNLYPAAGSNNGNGSTRRHPQQSPSNTSPCSYLPLMQEHHQLAAACAQLSEKLNPSHNQHHHHHHHQQQQQYQKAEAQKAVQEDPIDGGGGGGGNANGNTSK